MSGVAVLVHVEPRTEGASKEEELPLGFLLNFHQLPALLVILQHLAERDALQYITLRI